ncbi:TPA: hyaluronoglucosaminidase, partial [Streptococcus pyogenes]
MTETIPLRVQFKRMKAAEWASSDVVLLEGEIGFETDTGFAKFGDGQNTFSKLKYLTG